MIESQQFSPVSAEMEIFLQPIIPEEFVPFAQMILDGANKSEGLLTPRQVGIFTLIAFGFETKKVSDMLSTSPEIIDGELIEACKNLHVANQLQAVRWSLEHECIQPESIVPDDYDKMVDELTPAERSIADAAATLSTTNTLEIRGYPGIVLKESSIKTYLYTVCRKLNAADPLHAVITHMAYLLLPEELQKDYESKARNHSMETNVPSSDVTRVTPPTELYEEPTKFYWLPADEQSVRRGIRHGLTDWVMLLHFNVPPNDLVSIEKPTLVAAAPTYEKLAALFQANQPKSYANFQKIDTIHATPFLRKDGTETFVLIDSSTEEARTIPFSEQAANAVQALVREHFTDVNIKFPSNQYKERLVK
ncbi:MAG TPA: hypothetical protein VGT05_05280 [Patescibacteria group bacterium]|nr:hypothetical protein [Patescibacteria group bacterium]